MHRLSRLGVGLVVAALLSLTALPAFALVWLPKAPLVDPRTGSGVEGASASWIGGKIYVTHGYRFGDSPYTSIYDVGSDTWTHGGPTAPDAPNFQSEMGGATYAGKHYAIGGRAAPMGETWEFDPAGPTWTRKTPMLDPVAGAGAAEDDGSIYVAGGRRGASFGDTPVAEFQFYNPGSDFWWPAPLLPIPVSDTYATVSFGGKIYVFGGATSPTTVSAATQIYDISSGTWSLGAPMPTARGAAMAGVVCDLIAVFGGFDGTTNLVVTELYDPVADTWLPGPPMPSAVSEMAQGALYDGLSVYSIGGGIFGVSDGAVYELTGDCPTVQNDNTTWGRVKATYR